MNKKDPMHLWKNRIEHNAPARAKDPSTRQGCTSLSEKKLHFVPEHKVGLHLLGDAMNRTAYNFFENSKGPSSSDGWKPADFFT